MGPPNRSGFVADRQAEAAAPRSTRLPAVATNPPFFFASTPPQPPWQLVAEMLRHAVGSPEPPTAPYPSPILSAAGGARPRAGAAGRARLLRCPRFVAGTGWVQSAAGALSRPQPRLLPLCCGPAPANILRAVGGLLTCGRADVFDLPYRDAGRGRGEPVSKELMWPLSASAATAEGWCHAGTPNPHLTLNLAGETGSRLVLQCMRDLTNENGRGPCDGH
eukprot:scaffold28606_cov118-Isochrysis_galbana.AAC.2